MSDQPSVSIADIQRAVCERFGVPLMEMKSHRRSRCVARPRQVAMYLARRLTPFSFPEIGRLFGDRDHSTVIHAHQLVPKLATADKTLAEAVSAIEAELLNLPDPKQLILPLA